MRTFSKFPFISAKAWLTIETLDKNSTLCNLLRLFFSRWFWLDVTLRLIYSIWLKLTSGDYLWIVSRIFLMSNMALAWTFSRSKLKRQLISNQRMWHFRQIYMLKFVFKKPKWKKRMFFIQQKNPAAKLLSMVQLFKCVGHFTKIKLVICVCTNLAPKIFFRNDFWAE